MSVHVSDERDAVAGAPVDLDRLSALATHVCARERVPEAMRLAVLCVDEATMRELNAAHMGESGPTDVLAFPIDDPGDVHEGVPALLGDVVLCPAVARRQAAAAGHTLAAELDLLLVHGVLHLLGHDHAEAAERARMQARTSALLTEFVTQQGGGPIASGGLAE